MSRQSRVSFEKCQTKGAPCAKPATATKRSSTRLPPGKSKTCLRSTPIPKTSKLNMPALSIPPKTPPIDPILERLKKKTVRRNAPEGEDIKKIRQVIKGLQCEPVAVQEFVGLVSPYTGDNGQILRSVMGDDLSSFRRLAKRVYDTMTQDVSDVLANEQIHLTDYYNERYSLFIDKMMRAIDEIYRYVPNFDFELYYEDPAQYLEQLFPIKPEEPELDPEELDMQRRQEAYHRLQWLRSEGMRLCEENCQLQERLRELKQLQKQEMEAAARQEEVAEERKTHLEATEADLQDQLQELNESVEKSFTRTEEGLRLADNRNFMARASQRRLLTQTKPATPREPWNVRTAKRLERKSFTKVAESTISSCSLPKTGAKKKTQGKVKCKGTPVTPSRYPKPKESRDVSPFHYSPPKSPPCSPDRSTARGGTPQHKIVRIESSTTVVEETKRISRAPRDTWGGFK